MKSLIPKLYKQYFADKQDERRMLFEKTAGLFHPERGIYPGSFVHIAPSFYIQHMTYIDSDRRIGRFFKDDSLLTYIKENKKYSSEPSVCGYQADYTDELPVETESFDIMYSFYAGFISQSCKKYLKNGGILVCNNSHGDASMAFTDSDYQLHNVIKRRGEFFSITDQNLKSYFIKKDNSLIDRNKVLKSMRGENFTKKGFAYIFRLNR